MLEVSKVGSGGVWQQGAGQAGRLLSMNGAAAVIEHAGWSCGTAKGRAPTTAPQLRRTCAWSKPPTPLITFRIASCSDCMEWR